MRAPATRDQADAYRYGLRRMEAALVRGDPVPLHEQLRTQRRAAFAGVVLGLLGLCGAAVWALVVPRPDWRHEAVVLGERSGALYVVAHRPDRLVPVADLPAARLVLAALRDGGASDADPATARPVAVADEDLAGAPRTATAAVPGAPAVTPDATVAPRWAVCDRDDDARTLVGTTIVGGAPAPAPVAAGDGVLLAGPDGAEWLVTNGRRHRVDVGDGAVRVAFRLTRRLPRPATPGLLALVPEGPPLATPPVPGRGDPAPDGLPGHVGDVLVHRSGDAPEQFFVVLAGGLQEVPGAVAELLDVASVAREIHPVGTDVLGRATYVDALRVDGWPEGPVRVVEPDEAPVVCWTWAPDRPAGGVWFGRDVPRPDGAPAVTLAQADGPGDRIDAVAVGPGGAVRASTPDRADGPLWLVSASGVAHGVADPATAGALGITAAEPAPAAALALLPSGPVLDVAAARRVVDVLPP